MRLLLIDTVGLPNIVAYADSATGETHDALWKADADEAERILPAIQGVLQGRGPIEGIICVNGPGRFTSTRIGVAICNALAMAWKIPALGMDRLHFVRSLLLEEILEDIAVVSERGDYYVMRTGEDAIHIQESIDPTATLIDETVMVDAWNGGKKAFFRCMASQIDGVPLPHPVLPLYLRAPNITAKKKL